MLLSKIYQNFNSIFTYISALILPERTNHGLLWFVGFFYKMAYYSRKSTPLIMSYLTVLRTLVWSLSTDDERHHCSVWPTSEVWNSNRKDRRHAIHVHRKSLWHHWIPHHCLVRADVTLPCVESFLCNFYCCFSVEKNRKYYFSGERSVDNLVTFARRAKGYDVIA